MKSMNTAGLAMLRNARGFSLIELMVALVIVGILAGLAIPSYSRYVIKSNRTDAMNFLSEVAGEQQRYFSQNNQYAGVMSELGYGDEDTFESPEGLYTISITNPNGVVRGYNVRAIPVAGKRQEEDDECSTFILKSTGVKKNLGGTNDDCW